MNRADLESVWEGIDTPKAIQGLAGRPAPYLRPALGVLLAIDGHGLRHLLIPGPIDKTPPDKSVTHGLEVRIDDLAVGEQPSRSYLDVQCTDAAMHHNFSAVATEILEALELDPANPAKSLERIFARWRWFWGVPPEALSAEAAVGLFAELWFLEFWLDPIDGRTLTGWTGPSADRHDFKWTSFSVEVKATRARFDGAPTHRISRLDQLEEPEQGALYLFSMRATPDPVAAHSLNASVERIRAALDPEQHLVAMFNERLAAVGYSPAHREHYDTPLRVVAEELYRVDDGFPRLCRASFPNGIPNGVDKIAYTLDLVACASFLLATAPGETSMAIRATVS